MNLGTGRRRVSGGASWNMEGGGGQSELSWWCHGDYRARLSLQLPSSSMYVVLSSGCP